MVNMDDGEGADGRASATCVKKPRKTLSEEARRAKRENDRQRGRTRVNLGPAFSAWKKLRDKNGFKTDAEMAFFLINIPGRMHVSLPPVLKESDPPRSMVKAGWQSAG